MDLELGDTCLIIEEGKRQGLLRNHMAYVLSTAYWETARTMKPVKEAFWLTEDWRRKNLRYYPHYGRGYVQLTWLENYRKASQKLGVDFVSNPDLLLVPQHSAAILVLGMKEGWFRGGKKLSDYITLQRSDYKGARDIINGDQAKVVDGERIDDKLARFAREYEALLLAEGYGVDEVKPIPLPEPTPYEVKFPPYPGDAGANETKPTPTPPVGGGYLIDPPVGLEAVIAAIVRFFSRFFGGKK